MRWLVNPNGIVCDNYEWVNIAGSNLKQLKIFIKNLDFKKI